MSESTFSSAVPPTASASSPRVRSCFHEDTFSWTHIVSDPATGAAAIVDPVLDFDPASGRVSHEFIKGVFDELRADGLRLEWILETHIHADHLTASRFLKTRCPDARVACGAGVTTVQQVFGDTFNAEPEFSRDGAQFDHLFADGESVALGASTIRVLATPGHTPACVTYVIGDAAFVGDTLFMPDFGTARTDFPGGDAATLYASIAKILSLAPETRLFMCHDYGSETRSEFLGETTVAAERTSNIHLTAAADAAAFIALRERRNANLAAPRLLWPSVQFNMRAGAFPPAESNGAHYLKIPLSGTVEGER